MNHAAVTATSIISGRKEQVDSLLVHAGQLLVGGPHHSVAAYDLPSRTSSDDASAQAGPSRASTRPKWTLRLSKSAKATEQLYVIREANLLVTLCDSQVYLHDLASVSETGRGLPAAQATAQLSAATAVPDKATTQLIQTRGALSLALDTSIQRAPVVDESSGGDGWGAGYRHRAGKNTIGRAYRPSDVTMGKGSGFNTASSLRAAERPLSLLGMDDIRRNKEQQRLLGASTDYRSGDADGDAEGVMSVVTTLAVGSRRKLIVFRWVDGAFWDTKEISLPHTPRSLAFPTPTTLMMGYSAADFGILTIPLAAASSVADLLKSNNAPQPVTIPSTSVAGSRVDLYEWKARPLTVPLKGAGREGDDKTSESSQMAAQAQSDQGLGIPGAAGMASMAGAFTGLGGYIGISSKATPRLVQTEGAEVLVCRDTLGVFLNEDGKPSRQEGIEWQATPDEVAYVKPYILSVLPPAAKQVPAYPLLQVRSVGTLLSVQSLPFPPPDAELTKAQKASIGKAPSVRLMTPSPNGKAPIYVSVAPTERGALERDGLSIWCLEMKSWGVQIDELVAAGGFQEALALLHSVDEVLLENKLQRQRHIEALYALSLFQAERFDEAIERFIELDANPARVIALFPEYIAGPLATERKKWMRLFEGPELPEEETAQQVQPRSPEPKDTSDTASISSVRTGSSRAAAKPRPMLAGLWGRAAQTAETLTATPSATPPRRGMQPPKQASPTKTVDPSGAAEDAASVGDTTDGAEAPVKQEPATAPTTESEKRAVDALGRFLADRRRIFKPILQAQSTAHGITLSQTRRDPAWLLSLPSEPLSLLDTEQLTAVAQTVDTALFKTFLATKPGLLGPLCRVENWCEVTQVEELLMARKRYSELISLYGSKEMHDKALQLLRKMSEDVEDVEEKISPTIRYLQNLGPAHIDVILEASHWVLSLDADLGMEIFCADTGKVASLPRHPVVSDLETFNEALCIRYLDHLITAHNESDPSLHEKMAFLLLRRATAASTSQEDKASAIARLQTLLETSQQYRAERVLHRVPTEERAFFDIRALLLGRLGQDEAALRIYVDRLQEHTKAQEYCKRIRASNPKSPVFLTLLQIYLRPKQSDKGKPATAHELQLAPALSIIARYGAHIDACAALELLPAHISLSSVAAFASKTLQQSHAQRAEAVVASKLASERKLQSDETLERLHRRRIKVTEARTCPRCLKRLGNSVIAVTSRGAVLHYGCSRQESQ